MTYYMGRGTPMGDYYQGDYYRGDYYRGDPGFFSFIGGLAKRAVGLIPGVGPIAQSAMSLIPSGGSKLAKAGAVMEKVGPIVTKLKKPAAIGAGALAIGGVGAALGAHHARAARAAAGMKHHRRMNVCNARALRRAIRRTHGFAKLAMKTIHLVHPKKKVRFGGFRKRRAKR